jgi:cytochrome c oxidase accessory protein FixG
VTKRLNDIKVEVQGDSLYAKSDKIFPREIKGRFQLLRTASVYALLGLYYFLPFLQWDDRQAVLFDLPARKFHVFFLTFWPQDFIFLTLLLIMAGLLLFFVTAVAGRVWCGYACPQTVWTEAFIWMERWVEGSRAQQMKLNDMPWNATKVFKRSLKHTLWLSFSLFTGLVFVGYFYPIRELIPDFFSLQISGWALFWVLFYGFATYGNAGFMREQVCKYMCPYARFQSAMFDKDTLIVTYDEARGEPRSRGKKRKNDTQQAQGDCIDCGICVQVCPTGIDIRDGLQYECIACAACVDACDEVMTKINLPTGLVKYSTEALDQGQDKTLLQSVMRPRVMIYAALLSVIFISFIVALSMRSPFQVDILRDRNSLFRWADDAHIENIYQVKLMNKSQRSHRYSVSLEGLEGATAQWDNSDDKGFSRSIGAGEIADATLIVTVPNSDALPRSTTITLSFVEEMGEDKHKVVEETRFWGPQSRSGAR